MTTLAPADRPTMIFIGVTTGQSSINRVFPLWANALGLGHCALRGMDFKLHDDPARYREAIEFIKHDPLTLGALVTTHKMDLFSACGDLFNKIEPLAAQMGEISSIYKRNGKLHGRAADPWTCGHALNAFLPTNHWRDTKAETLILGAGGSAIALAWHLSKPEHGANRPSKIHVADLSLARLDHLRVLHDSWQTGVPLVTHHVPQPELADIIVRDLPPGSLIANATGLGKDAPGSPLTQAAIFPDDAFVWEFNYRGQLVFLEQARAQEKSRQLHIEDGWTYFIHGWSHVIADVFHVVIPPHGELIEQLSQLAATAR